MTFPVQLVNSVSDTPGVSDSITGGPGNVLFGRLGSIFVSYEFKHKKKGLILTVI